MKAFMTFVLPLLSYAATMRTGIGYPASLGKMQVTLSIDIMKPSGDYGTEVTATRISNLGYPKY